MFIGLAMAELASAAPTSGGVSYRCSLALDRMELLNWLFLTCAALLLDLLLFISTLEKCTLLGSWM